MFSLLESFPSNEWVYRLLAGSDIALLVVITMYLIGIITHMPTGAYTRALQMLAIVASLALFGAAMMKLIGSHPIFWWVLLLLSLSALVVFTYAQVTSQGLAKTWFTKWNELLLLSALVCEGIALVLCLT